MMALRVALGRSGTRVRSRNWRLLSSTNGANGANGADSSSSSTASSSIEWRKIQLEKLSQKFTAPAQAVESEDDVQPMWKEMESRVTKRRPLTKAQRGGRVGRINVRKTDEEIWLQEGLYDEQQEEKKDDK